MFAGIAAPLREFDVAGQRDDELLFAGSYADGGEAYMEGETEPAIDTQSTAASNQTSYRATDKLL